MKLVYKLHQTDDFTYDYIKYICFEYESKNKFIEDVLDKIYSSKLNYIEIFNETINIEYLDNDIFYNVLTLDEFFEQNKEIPFSGISF